MVTSYYDTAKGALHRKGVFLRIREQGRRIEQTVKTAGEGGVLSRRGEWTWPLKTPQPDLDLAATTGLKPLERRARKGGLVKRFASEIARRIAMVETPEATLELALDEGVVRAGRRSVPLLELEIEVKRGDPMAVFALARELIALPGVTIGFATKASRGFELASGAEVPCHVCEVGVDGARLVVDARGLPVEDAVGVSIDVVEAGERRSIALPGRVAWC